MSRRTTILGTLAVAVLALPAGLAFLLAEPAIESRAASGDGLPLQLAQASQAQRPVVVELFTSQGCNSCPPADALLGELAAQPGILALSFHVDYWDYIGWKDPFASAQYTQRQRDYAAELRLRYVYTPQIVVDGRHDVVGSQRGAVTRAIQGAAGAESPVTVTLDEAGDETEGGRVRLSAGKAPAGGATVWLVTFDDRHQTDVARGENRGRALTNSNVVREFTALGTWTGEAMEFPLDIATARAEGRGGCAVIVQQGRAGPILGAALMDLDGPSG